MNIKTIITLIALCLAANISYAQTKTSDPLTNSLKRQYKPSNPTKNIKPKTNKKDNHIITNQMLEKATKVIYGFNNGSVAPEYQYQGYVEVTPVSLSLKIYNCSNITYSSSITITSQQYKSLLKAIYDLDIKKDPDPYYCDGGDVYTLTIYHNSKKLFECDMEEYCASNGNLGDVFYNILTPDMKKAYADPPLCTDDNTGEDIFDDIIE